MLDWCFEPITYAAALHPQVEPELRCRQYALCLDVQLNGRDRSVMLKAGQNATSAAQELLRGEPNLDINDTLALATMSGWVESRTALKVLARMAVRQRLRRSSTPPQMLISSGRCGRPGGLDVQTITLGDRTSAEPAPWIVADFSAINAHDPRDWAWLLHGRAALQRLVLPLPTLHDIAYHQRQEEVSEEYGEPGMGDYASLLRAVKVVSRAARPHLRPNASLTFALPYCGPDYVTSDFGVESDYQHRRNLCDAVVGFLKQSFAQAVVVRHCASEAKDVQGSTDGKSARLFVKAVEGIARQTWSPGALALRAFGRRDVRFVDKRHVADEESSHGELEWWSIVDVMLGFQEESKKGSSCPVRKIITSVINLDRRPDRWEAMQKQVKGLYGSKSCASEGGDSGGAVSDFSWEPSLERLSAVDGPHLFRSTLAAADSESNGSDWEAQWLTSRKAIAAQFDVGGWNYRPEVTDLSIGSPRVASGTYGGRASALNPHPDHGWRPAVIGCALSHLRLWRRIALTAYDDMDELHVLNFLHGKNDNLHKSHNTPTPTVTAIEAKKPTGDIYQPFLVLEDDAVLSKDFAERFAATMAVADRDFSWDIIFLGVLDDRDLYGDEPAAFSCIAHRQDFKGKSADFEDYVNDGGPTFVSEPSHDPYFPQTYSSRLAASSEDYSADHSKLRCLLRHVSPVGRIYGSGLFAYVIRPRGARALLHAAATAGPIMQPVDWWVWEKLNANAFAPFPSEQPAWMSPAEGRKFEEPGTSGGADERHLHRLVGLKASPPLAVSPEGLGRDSDNDETYSSARFLQPSSRGRKSSITASTPHVPLEATSTSVELSAAQQLLVRRPLPGAVLPLDKAKRGEGEVEIEVVVTGPSNVFLEMHKHSLVCVQIDRAPDPTKVEDAIVQKRSLVIEAIRNGANNSSISLASFEASRAQCRTIDDAHLFLPAIKSVGHFHVYAFLIDSGIGGARGSTIEGNAADIELRVIAISAPRRFQVALETNDTRTVDKNLSVVAEWEEAESDNIIKLEKIGAKVNSYRGPTGDDKEAIEESVIIQVELDSAPVEFLWRPYHESVYDVSRAFCVERVHLTDVEPAVLCVDSIVTALLKERRRQAKEKGWID